MIDVFQRNYAVKPGTDCFRRYLVRALALGTVRSYFMRKENDEVRSVANLATVPPRKRPFRNKVEQDIITRELLDQMTSFPHSRPQAVHTLHCIRQLGPPQRL